MVYDDKDQYQTQITRIEGHLRIDVEVEGGSVSKAWASCTMWRGIENILLGRDPREAWLFTQRFCGVCTTVHAMASVRAVEDALRLPIPPNAQFIRNLILINHALHDHIVHFYQLSALDWVDIMTIPNANPSRLRPRWRRALSDWTNNSDKEFGAAQDKVKALAASGQLGMFRQRILGTSGDASAAGSEPHRLRALSAGAGISAESVAGSRHARAERRRTSRTSPSAAYNAINLDSQGTLNMDRLYTSSR